MAESNKSNSWDGIKVLVFILWAVVTIWEATRLTLGLTADAAVNRKWWLYPVVGLLWVFVMIPVGLLVLVVGLLLITLLGFLMDMLILMGIDKLLAGQTGGGIGYIAGGLVALLAASGFMYECIRQDNPGESSRFHLAATMVAMVILAGCGTIPYIHAAMTGGLPFFGR